MSLTVGGAGNDSDEGHRGRALAPGLPVGDHDIQQDERELADLERALRQVINLNTTQSGQDGGVPGALVVSILSRCLLKRQKITTSDDTPSTSTNSESSHKLAVSEEMVEIAQRMFKDATTFVELVNRHQAQLSEDAAFERKDRQFEESLLLVVNSDKKLLTSLTTLLEKISTKTNEEDGGRGDEDSSSDGERRIYHVGTIAPEAAEQVRQQLRKLVALRKSSEVEFVTLMERLENIMIYRESREKDRSYKLEVLQYREVVAQITELLEEKTKGYSFWDTSIGVDRWRSNVLETAVEVKGSMGVLLANELAEQIALVSERGRELQEALLTFAYRRLKGSFINLRHLQITIREDFCIIIGFNPGDDTTACEEYCRIKRLQIRIDREASEYEPDSMKGEAEEIKHLCDEDLVKEVEEVINDSTDPKYDGYRKMLNVKGEERSQLMNFIFSRTSPGTREVNTKCFAQSFAPDMALYRNAIMELAPDHERRFALVGLDAVESYTPIADRRFVTDPTGA